MKCIKRILSVIMIMTMIFTSLPVMAAESGVKTTVTATPDVAGANKVTADVVPEDKKEMTTATSDELIYGDITRAEWLHKTGDVALSRKGEREIALLFLSGEFTV